jgi:hypothetical protein
LPETKKFTVWTNTWREKTIWNVKENPVPENDAGETLKDFITGRIVPDIGAEANRQQVEKILVELKGYDRQEIEVDAPIALDMEGGPFTSTLDLVVRVRGWRYLVIKCAPGSLASREREVIAAARLVEKDYQVPLAAASDGRTALVWDTVSGKLAGEGMEAIPDRERAEASFDPQRLQALDLSRRWRQQLIFRSYDSHNVHRRDETEG